MNSLDLPQILYQPFAATGDKNTILDSPSTTAPQRANLQTGFPPITQIPIDNGGIPPERMDFNGLGYLLSSFYFFTQCGGVYTFNRNVSNAIGGYPLGAVLYYTDSNGTTYKVRSLLENNTFDFVTTPSYIDDEHWEYVSSTPITQDTSASSTSNVFSTAAVQSLLNTVVHLTGTQSISGTKTFLAKTNMAPIELYPVGSGGSYIDFHYNNSTSDYTSRIWEQASGNLVVTANNFTINANGYARASDVNGSIVTTVNKSKSANGYFKLGNGLIVQWGVTSTGGGDKTVTLPTAFTSTNYSVSTAWSYNGTLSSSIGHFTIKSHSTTNFVYHNESSNAASFWIAIGY